MAIRQIIEIDEGKCDGCGQCETGCPEGALRVIEGKARLVGESLCDGLGACIGQCPRGAISVTTREAPDYNEAKVIEGIARQGSAVLRAHIDHLESHGQAEYLTQARRALAAMGVEEPPKDEPGSGKVRHHTAPVRICPGARERFAPVSRPGRKSEPIETKKEGLPSNSELGNWPIQLHLINPRSPSFAKASLIVAADCTAFALAGFHGDLLSGRKLAIACPKLDRERDHYVEKLAVMMTAATSITVAIMEVPCCSGLVKLVLEARARSGKNTAIDVVTLGIEGRVIARQQME